MVVRLFFCGTGEEGGRGWDLRGWSHWDGVLVRVLFMSIGWGGGGQGFKALDSA